MQFRNFNVFFFFLVLLGVSALAFLIVRPFLVPFLMAVILASLFSFVYRFFLKITRQSPSISSGLTCAVVALVILIPILFIASLVANEVYDLVTQTSVDTSGISNVIVSVNNKIETLPGMESLDIQNFFSPERIITLVKSFSENALLIIQKTYQGVAHFAFVVVVTFFSLFFILIDGKKWLDKVIKLSPLRDKYENKLIDKFNSIARATIKGSILVAMVQGILAGILFALTGVYSPVLLGIVSAISSVIPSVGTALVWLPVGIIMIILGNVGQGMAILLVGFFVIGMVDNILKPKLVGRDTEMHPLLIFFSILGGIGFFGIVGFIIGPMVMSFFLVLWEIYSVEFREQLKEYNKDLVE